MQYFKERNSLVWKFPIELLVGVIDLWCCGCLVTVICLREPHWNNYISEKIRIQLGLEIVCQKDIFFHAFFLMLSQWIPNACQELVRETVGNNKVYKIIHSLQSR